MGEAIDLSFFASVFSTFALVFAAEMGDKSQLVCMTLASRYRPVPVFIGASLAFILLNTIAVLFGSAIANFVPPIIITSIVALLFLAFGLHALFAKSDDDESKQASVNKQTVFGLIASTFMLMTLAELGDKTQIAVVALSSSYTAWAVFIGATLALLTTAAIGVWAGSKLLRYISPNWLSRLTGSLFLLLAGLTSFRTYTLWLAH